VVNEGTGQFDPPDGSDDGSDWAGLVIDLYTAIDSLDAELKEVVMLHYFQGLAQAEVGELLGVHEDTVKRRWASAKIALADKLAPFAEG
jgi:RNA polymerase sigma factor (sigma-70 family)